MAGGVADETVQMALSKSSRTFGKTSQRRAVLMGTPWTSLPVTDSTPREASDGNYEMYQTMVFLAKNLLHPQFPWRRATEMLEMCEVTLAGSQSRLCSPPEVWDLKNLCILHPSDKSLSGFRVPFTHVFPFQGSWGNTTLSLEHLEAAQVNWLESGGNGQPQGARGAHILALTSLLELAKLCQDSAQLLSSF